MAADLEALKSTVEQLTNENQSMKHILDIKQDEWIKIEGSTCKNVNISTNDNTANKTTVSNRFAILEVEEDGQQSESPDNTIEQPQEINGNTANETTVSNRFDNTIEQPQENNGNTANESTAPNCSDTLQVEEDGQESESPDNIVEQQQPQENFHSQVNDYRSKHDRKFLSSKKVLVIGDSMVKNIDNKKIGRASRSNTTCHSYSGAKINDIQDKMKENHLSKDQGSNYEYDSIIVHVGTNDLVEEQPQQVGAKMEKLIVELKTHAKTVAVSEVIKRYDGLVSNNIINAYNNLLHDLCLKHNISLIQNNTIEKSLLNQSNLHLNNNGDRVLGKTFCDYLKSLKHVVRSRHFLGAGLSHQMREWTKYLKYVNKLLSQ